MTISPETELPNGWIRKPNGDVWDGAGPHARPIFYAVKDGWMVAGIRSADELHEIARIVKNIVRDTPL